MKDISLKNIIEKYKHALVLLYVPLYFIWFGYIERTITSHFHIIHMWIDDQIPFIEYFVVPYMLWFPYVGAAIIILLFTDKEEYIKTCKFLFTGMTVFLIVSSIYPNGHYLRPMVFEHDNIFVTLTQIIYSNDTATNLFPSIHVFNSIGVNIAVHRSKTFANHKYVKIGSTILMWSIILSTMFLKQHSVFDVICGFIMAAALYRSIYANEPAFETSPEKALNRVSQ